MKYKKSPSRIAFMTFAYLLLIAVFIVSVVPLWHVVMGSISNPTSTTTTRSLILYPLKNVDFQAYRIIGQYNDHGTSFDGRRIHLFAETL